MSPASLDTSSSRVLWSSSIHTRTTWTGCLDSGDCPSSSQSCTLGMLCLLRRLWVCLVQELEPAEQSVDHIPCLAQVRRRSQGLQPLGTWPVEARPLRGNQGAAAVRVYHEELENTVTANRAHDLEGAPIEGMVWSKDGHRLAVVGSL